MKSYYYGQVKVMSRGPLLHDLVILVEDAKINREYAVHWNYTNNVANDPIMYSVPDTISQQIANAKVLISVYSPNKKLTAKEIMDKVFDLMEAQSDFLKACDKLNIIGTGDKEEKKALGMYAQKRNPEHAGAFFPIYLKQDHAFDKYVMRRIRPTGNIL